MSAIGGIPQKTDSDMEFSVPDVYEGVPLGSVTVEQRKEEEEEDYFDKELIQLIKQRKEQSR